MSSVTMGHSAQRTEEASHLTPMAGVGFGERQQQCRISNVKGWPFVLSLINSVLFRTLNWVSTPAFDEVKTGPSMGDAELNCRQSNRKREGAGLLN